MMVWYGNELNGWGYGLMAVNMVAFWGLVIFGVVALVRYLARDERSRHPQTTQRLTPEEVLTERFARGEIDEQDYRTRRDALHGRTDSTIKS